MAQKCSLGTSWTVEARRKSDGAGALSFLDIMAARCKRLLTTGARSEKTADLEFSILASETTG